MLILTRSDVESALSMTDAIAAMRDGFAQLATGKATAPIRVSLEHPSRPGVTLFMPGLLRGSGGLAVKVVSVRPQNPGLGLPFIHGLVVLLDDATGRPLAVLEGGSLTAIRTGAASGLATDLLARGDARVAAVLGSGAQARTQLAAVRAVRPITEVRVHSRTPANAAAFIAAQQDTGLTFHAAGSANEAVSGADLICCATRSSDPLFDGSLLKPGTHVNAVGTFTPEAREFDFTTIQRCSKIVIDQQQGARAEAGELIQAVAAGILGWDQIHAEIGEIAAGLKAGRESEDEITLFKSVGNAVQDVAAAQMAYRRARERGLGTEVEL